MTVIIVTMLISSWRKTLPSLQYPQQMMENVVTINSAMSQSKASQSTDTAKFANVVQCLYCKKCKVTLQS